jgi:DNA-binding PadR family transcriptional regulator
MPGSPDDGFAFFDPSPMLLGLLCRGPRHGYQLYQEYKRELADIWDLGLSRLYSVVQQLQERGAVKVEVVEQVEAPAKKLLRLTNAGRHEFDAWVREPVLPLRSVRVSFLAKLRLDQLLELQGRERLIQAQIEACRQVLAESAEPGDEGELVRSYRQAQAGFLIEWLRSLLEQPPAAGGAAA